MDKRAKRIVVNVKLFHRRATQIVEKTSLSGTNEALTKNNAQVGLHVPNASVFIIIALNFARMVYIYIFIIHQIR